LALHDLAKDWRMLEERIIRYHDAKKTNFRTKMSLVRINKCDKDNNGSRNA